MVFAWGVDSVFIGFIGLIGLTRFIGLMGLIGFAGFVGLIGLIGLIGCIGFVGLMFTGRFLVWGFGRFREEGFSGGTWDIGILWVSGLGRIESCEAPPPPTKIKKTKTKPKPQTQAPSASKFSRDCPKPKTLRPGIPNEPHRPSTMKSTVPWFLVGNEEMRALYVPLKGLFRALLPSFPTKNQPAFLKTLKPLKALNP